MSGCGNEQYAGIKNAAAAPSSTSIPTSTPSSTASATPTPFISPTPTATPTPALTPSPTPDFPKQFTINGNKILDENGNETVFRGVNILDPAWMDAVYYNLNDAYFSQLELWKAKIIRIPIHPASYKYYGASNYLRILDKTLKLAAAHKIYAILDFHSIGFPPDQTYMNLYSDGTPWTGPIYSYTDQEIKGFWTTISTYYKNDDRVAFYEIFNEPTNRVGATEIESWNAWKTKAEEIIDLIRNINPNAKIIVSGINYSYDISFAESNPINRSNIVYGTHPYPNQSKSSDAAFGDLKAKYPVFATEFGYDPEATGKHYIGSDQYGIDTINYLESKKISWTVWSFSTDWLPALLTDWSYNQTASGTLFKAYLQSLN